MVSQACYPAADTRRYTSHRFTSSSAASSTTFIDNGFLDRLGLSERRGFPLAAYPHHHQRAPRPALPMADSQIDSEAQPSSRKRIAIACARCRKRKIRCSGPAQPGTDLPCTNCKGANIEACHYHRVGNEKALFQTQLKTDHNNFTYNTAASRAYVTRSLASPLAYSDVVGHDMVSATYHRHHHPSSYGYSAKSASCAAYNLASPYSGTAYSPGYGGGADDYASDYSIVKQESVPMALSPASWKQQAGYEYATDYSYDPATTTSIAHRPAPSSHPQGGGGFSLSSVAASLPSHSHPHTAERLLPTPLRASGSSLSVKSSGGSLDDMATAASYASGTPGYEFTATRAGPGYMAGHASPSSSSADAPSTSPLYGTSPEATTTAPITGSPDLGSYSYSSPTSSSRTYNTSTADYVPASAAYSPHLHPSPSYYTTDQGQAHQQSSCSSSSGGGGSKKKQSTTSSSIGLGYGSQYHGHGHHRRSRAHEESRASVGGRH